MKTLRQVLGGTAATVFGTMVALAAPMAAQAAETPTDAHPSLVEAYGPYASEGTCNYWRAQVPGKKSICFHNGSDGWHFTTPS